MSLRCIKFRKTTKNKIEAGLVYVCVLSVYALNLESLQAPDFSITVHGRIGVCR